MHTAGLVFAQSDILVYAVRNTQSINDRSTHTHGPHKTPHLQWAQCGRHNPAAWWWWREARPRRSACTIDIYLVAVAMNANRHSWEVKASHGRQFDLCIDDKCSVNKEQHKLTGWLAVNDLTAHSIPTCSQVTWNAIIHLFLLIIADRKIGFAYLDTYR